MRGLWCILQHIEGIELTAKRGMRETFAQNACGYIMWCWFCFLVLVLCVLCWFCFC